MSTNIKFGVVLEINGQDVPLSINSVTDVKKNGVEFSLPHRVEIGNASDLSTFLETLTDDQLTLPSGKDFPSPLDTVYQKLTELNLAIEELKLKIPPSQAQDGSAITPRGSTTFTLGLSATWNDEEKISMINSKLAIKGLYVKVEKT